MNRPSKTYNFVSADKAQQILNAYGGDPEHWPIEYRDALLAAIEKSPDLRDAQRTSLQFDQLLVAQHKRESDRVSDEDATVLAAKIIRELPPQNIAASAKQSKDRRSRFGFPKLRIWWPAPALVAAGLVAIVVTLLPNEQPLPNSAAELAFEKWAWEDVTAQTLVPESSTDPSVEDELDDLIGLRQDG